MKGGNLLNQSNEFRYELDAIDHKILEMLLENSRYSMRDIAKKVFLSSTAVAARVERLERNNIISGYHVSVNPIMMGYYVKAYIQIQVEPRQKNEFYPYMEKHRHVLECDCVTGEYTMLIKVIFRTTMELDQFINEIQSFGKTNTLIVFSTAINHREAFWMSDEI